MQDKRLSFVIVLLLSLIIFGSFREALQCQFITAYDDAIYITENSHIASGLSLKGVFWALKSAYASNWHPLTWLSHMLDVQVFGLTPAGHHMTSLLFHIASAGLLFTLLHRCTNAIWKSALVALLFAIHPTHVESVVWVSERKDVLSTFFAFLTMHSYISYTKKKRAGPYLLTLLLFSCSLMSKPMVVTLPVILLLIDIWPLNRLLSAVSIKAVIAEKIPFFVLSFLTAIITFLAQREAGALSLAENLSVLERVSHSMSSYLDYIFLLLWPFRLSAYYPFPENISLAGGLFSFILLSGISWAVTLFFKTKKYFLVGWAWFLVTLFPVIGVVQAGAQGMADRYTYLPSVGIFILVVFGVGDLQKRRPCARSAFIIGALAVSICFITLTARQVPLWYDSITLFEHTVSVTDKNIHAHHNLGAAYSSAGRTDEAILQYRKVLGIRPWDSLAHHNLGLAFMKKNNTSAGVYHFQEALKSDPEQALTHYNLALALLEMNAPEAAVRHLKKVISLKPEFKDAYFTLGIIERRRRKFPLAEEYFSEAVRIDPDFSEAHINIGNIMEDVYGDTDRAYYHYRAALDVSPDYPEAHNSMGILLAKKGRVEEAKKHFERALSLRPEYKDARSNLERVLGSSEQ